MLLCSRLIPSLLSDSLVGPSREPRENPPPLESWPLLSPEILLLPVPSLLLRSGLPVEVGTELFLSLIELPMRDDLLELIRLLELPVRGCVLRVLGVLVLIELPIRDDLLELIPLLERPARGCVLRVLGVLVLMELPMRDDLLELVRLPELLDGLRVLEVTPDRIVTGRLADARLD